MLQTAEVQRPVASLGEKEEEKSTQESEDPFLVILDSEDDPKHMAKIRKWVIVLVICSGALCATCASSMV